MSPASVARPTVWPLAIGLLSAIALMALLTPCYPGTTGTLLAFVVVASALVVSALSLRPSFFLSLVACFLTLGFPIKLVATLVFGASLVEPVGDFDGSAAQWDRALGFASAGLLGCFAAVLVSSRMPTRRPAAAEAAPWGRRYRRALLYALVFLLLTSAGVYWLNADYHLLRIGYPARLALPFPLGAMAAFVITWGALLGGLALAWWLVERTKMDGTWLLYTAIVLGLGASMTMGSRAQFLLYFGAALLAVASLPGRGWLRQLLAPKVIIACVVAVLAFGGSLALVSLQRSHDFSPALQHLPGHGPDSPDEAAGDEGTPRHGPRAEDGRSDGIPRDERAGKRLARPRAAPAPLEQRMPFILREVQHLVILRWVGLEGVLTLAGAGDRLGWDLFVTGLLEDPAAGMEGLYQRMSGEPYAGVSYFTFLTLPGPVGVAGYAGSLAVVAGALCVLLLAGHLVEWLGDRLLHNVGANAVVGVSLAYLVVQMCFPWTLFAYVVQLVGALFVLAVFDRTLKAALLPSPDEAN